MEITILIPHWKTKEMTTYSVAQFLKCKGKHNVTIIVIDNSYPDESIYGLNVFDEIEIIQNTSTKISSHGIAFDMAMPYVKTEWFMCAESDSFPTQENYLDYYEDLINKGYDFAGSLLQLSGGQFIHPTGAIYKKSVWEEAKKYCDNIEYRFFPNLSRFGNFDCHLMVHKRFAETFLNNPGKYIEVGKDYKDKTKEQILASEEHYSPIINPFHNGMGNTHELLSTYGYRNIESEPPHTLLNNNENLVSRIGMEPGQWFCYWQLAMGKKMFVIPTDTKWLPNRENQQQEYTKMENGFTHLWGVSAYKDCNSEELQDIIKFKNNQVEELYNSLPEHQKIK